ncbi:tRNA 2-selenouridine(34) synthase MnmH [soil metagenome]
MHDPRMSEDLLSERLRFDTIIDARSPGEFALDRIPGAINCPVLDDAERAEVGTIYKQQGAFEARRIGGAMVADNLARHLRGPLADRPRNWKPLVYCWRGGLRSGSMVQWLRLVGWDARQLPHGYQAWRRHAIALIERLGPALELRVICGPTGTAKTRVLQALSALGEQVLDLEDFAAHKGSSLGDLPDRAQPTQKAFETQLADALERFDLARPVFIEAESRRIGKIAVPTPLLARLRSSPCIELRADVDTRLEFLLRDYGYLGDDRARLAAQVGALKGLHSNETLARWRQWAIEGDLRALFRELMVGHYDPLYTRSQRANLSNYAAAPAVDVTELSAAGIDRVAEEVLAVSRMLVISEGAPSRLGGPQYPEPRLM